MQRGCQGCTFVHAGRVAKECTFVHAERVLRMHVFLACREGAKDHICTCREGAKDACFFGMQRGC